MEGCGGGWSSVDGGGGGSGGGCSGDGGGGSRGGGGGFGSGLACEGCRLLASNPTHNMTEGQTGLVVSGSRRKCFIVSRQQWWCKPFILFVCVCVDACLFTLTLM